MHNEGWQLCDEFSEGNMYLINYLEFGCFDTKLEVASWIQEVPKKTTLDKLQGRIVTK